MKLDFVKNENGEAVCTLGKFFCNTVELKIVIVETGNRFECKMYFGDIMVNRGSGLIESRDIVLSMLMNTFYNDIQHMVDTIFSGDNKGVH